MKRRIVGAVTVLATVGGITAGALAAPGTARATSTAWYQTLQVNTSGGFSDIAAISKTNVWAVGTLDDSKGNTLYQPQSFAAHWNGSGWHTLSPPSDIIADTGNVVLDGKGGYWFGDQAILTGTTWSTEPNIAVSGGLGRVVRIPGTESFLQPASVSAANSSIQNPTIYRFDL